MDRKLPDVPGAAADRALWPDLPYAAWKDTCTTLHLWTQVVGKIRLARAPWLNHSWHVPLYVTARGLSTSAMPYQGRSLEITFDFIDHVLRFEASDGQQRKLDLAPRSVAEFYARVMSLLESLGMPVRIRQMPSEIADAIPFSLDHLHAAYDPVYAQRFWRVLVQAERVLARFRTAFIGKCSPVHFFWGSFDLAVTRFSGRRAPAHPGGVPHLPDSVVREAYSHEVSSVGFWPGGSGIDDAAFYSYAYPEPAGFRDAPVQPEAARYDATLGEFLLPYDAVRAAADGDAALMAFCQTTYDAAADAAHWDRNALECEPGRIGIPRPVDVPTAG